MGRLGPLIVAVSICAPALAVEIALGQTHPQGLCIAEGSQGADETRGLSRVQLNTSIGPIMVWLCDSQAPLTTQNFKRYVNEGFYDGLVFHRVIKGFVVQGGGFDELGVARSPTHLPIKNEAATSGLSNVKYAVSMARTNEPDSASSQFFINTADNLFLDPGGTDAYGYAVFGYVDQLDGHSAGTVDTIESAPVMEHDGNGPATWPSHCTSACPVDPVVIKSATIVHQPANVATNPMATNVAPPPGNSYSRPVNRALEILGENPDFVKRAQNYSEDAQAIQGDANQVLSVVSPIVGIKARLQGYSSFGVSAWDVVSASSPGVSEAFASLEFVKSEAQEVSQVSQSFREAAEDVNTATSRFLSNPTDENLGRLKDTCRTTIPAYEQASAKLGQVASRIDDAANAIGTIRQALERGSSKPYVGSFIGRLADEVGNAESTIRSASGKLSAYSASASDDAQAMQAVISEEPNAIPWLAIGAGAAGLLLLFLIVGAARRRKRRNKMAHVPEGRPRDMATSGSTPVEPEHIEPQREPTSEVPAPVTGAAPSPEAEGSEAPEPIEGQGPSGRKGARHVRTVLALALLILLGANFLPVFNAHGTLQHGGAFGGSSTDYGRYEFTGYVWWFESEITANAFWYDAHDSGSGTWDEQNFFGGAFILSGAWMILVGGLWLVLSFLLISQSPVGSPWPRRWGISGAFLIWAGGVFALIGADDISGTLQIPNGDHEFIPGPALLLLFLSGLAGLVGGALARGSRKVPASNPSDVVAPVQSAVSGSPPPVPSTEALLAPQSITPENQDSARQDSNPRAP